MLVSKVANSDPPDFTYSRIWLHCSSLSRAVLGRISARYLRSRSSSSRSGKNGMEAVNLIKEFSPELVFLDVQMPGLDGFGAIKKLIDKKVPLPQIVFATAFDQYAVKAFEVNAAFRQPQSPKRHGTDLLG